jgi:hypothetical protein
MRIRFPAYGRITSGEDERRSLGCYGAYRRTLFSRPFLEASRARKLPSGSQLREHFTVRETHVPDKLVFSSGATRPNVYYQVYHHFHPSTSRHLKPLSPVITMEYLDRLLYGWPLIGKKVSESYQPFAGEERVMDIIS